MDTLRRITFQGKYRLFYPSQDLSDPEKSIIITSSKKIFGPDTKVYFTEESEPELLQEVEPGQKMLEVPGLPDAPVVISQEAIDKAKALREKRINEAPPVSQPVRNVDQYMREQKLGSIPANEGRDMNW